MEGSVTTQRDGSPTRPAYRRAASSSSLLFKFPFMRPSAENEPPREYTEETSQPAPRASASVIQQQKTRRRRGSLRKAALLGRGAQRERRDGRPLTIDTSHAAAFSPESMSPRSDSLSRDNTMGYKTSDSATLSSIGGSINQMNLGNPSPSSMQALTQLDRDTSSPYASTDEDDILQLPRSSASLRQGISLSSGSEPYYGNLGTSLPRTAHHAKSPLSYSGLSSSTLPPHDSDWDYTDTEWWGWVLLCITWFVFVIGMGSCFDVWSWAWDVGKTPYAPPELEDDPTLPITGYYPALIILTGVMAWVWVVVAWVGMKYFRHAKISGD